MTTDRGRHSLSLWGPWLGRVALMPPILERSQDRGVLILFKCFLGPLAIEYLSQNILLIKSFNILLTTLRSKLTPLPLQHTSTLQPSFSSKIPKTSPFLIPHSQKLLCPLSPFLSSFSIFGQESFIKLGLMFGLFGSSMRKWFLDFLKGSWREIICG